MITDEPGVDPVSDTADLLPAGETSPHFRDCGAAHVPALESAAAWVLAAAEEKDARIAKQVRSIMTLRAARGGHTNQGVNARRPLAHARLKTVLLSNDHRSILKHLADAHEELAPLFAKVLEKILQVELLEADLLRCNDALERQAEDDAEYDFSKLYPEARELVRRLARRGILEGHLSTIRDATVDAIVALIQADNEAAGVGSPENPQVKTDRARPSR